MTKTELESKLDQALQSFHQNVQLVVSDPYGKRQITEGELFEVMRQTFYTLDHFRKAILEYLP